MTKTMIRLPMDMHNVFRECELGTETWDKNAKAVVDSGMRDLIEKIARKRPHWQFISEAMGRMRDDGSYAYVRFVIEDSGDRLGKIDLARDWRTGEHVFELDNPRLRAKRERNGYTKTKKVDKAVKLVVDNYYGRTLPERLSVARAERNTVLSDVMRSASYKVDRIMRELQPQLVSFLTNNPQIAEQITMQEPSSAANLTTLPGACQEAATTRVIYDANQVGAGVTVLAWRDRFYTVGSVSDTPDTVEYNYDTVPPHIAMGIGMLKLVGIKESIPDIGTRVSEDVFFVVNPEQQP